MKREHLKLRRLLSLHPISRRYQLLEAFQQPNRSGRREFSIPKSRRPTAQHHGNTNTPERWIKEEPYYLYSNISTLRFGLGHKFFVRAYAKLPRNKKEGFSSRLRRWILVITLPFGVYYALKFLNRDSEIKVLDPPKFTPFIVVGKEEVSPTSFIITLRPKPFVDAPKSAGLDPYMKEWERGIWSVEFKQPQLQIARSYTPLPPLKQGANGDLRFLIRREKNGEMSRYIVALPVGGQIELRGPYLEVDLPEEVTDVLFLAGGTGIAPALQAAHTLLDVRNKAPKLPKIHIVWANRRREDCEGGINSTEASILGNIDDRSGSGTLVNELQKLQESFPHNLTVDYFIDEEGIFLDLKKLSNLTKRFSESKHGTLTSTTNSRLLFISGPAGFVNFLAGPKRWVGATEVQGELGGVIGQMQLRNWKVWKL